MSVVVGGWHCDECGAADLMEADMGKFYAANEGHGKCGVCLACLRRMGVLMGGKMLRGTNRTPPKKRRRKR